MNHLWSINLDIEHLYITNILFGSHGQRTDTTLFVWPEIYLFFDINLLFERFIES